MSHARPASEADAKAETSGGGGGDSGPGSFSEQGFVEKLNKLNNTATKIQTLSNWCIFHRKRARKVVDIWEKRFNNATKDKKVSFLYLSNDILQNSKRKGGEFVNEFWRVLPGLLKDFYDNGEEDAKKVVGRLIGIWDDRKVFGTRIESLKEDILGGTTHTIGNNGSSSNPSSNPSSLPKAVRKDSSTTMKKLTVGGIPEMIVTAYQSVLDRHFDEDTALNKCKSAISVLEKMGKDVDDACTQGIQPPSSLVSDLQGQEAILKQCIEQLESVDTARITLINKLREALTEQEAKSELLRNQLHIARTKTEHAMQLRQRLGGALNNGAGSSSSPLMVPQGQTVPMMHNSATRPMFPQFQPLHPSTSVPATSSAVRDEPKKTAAAMADKLASLSAPEQVLSSIFSSLAAEAASRNGGSPSGELSAGPPGFETNKKPRLENPIHASDIGPSPFFGQLPQVPPQIGGTQPPMQSNQAPGSFPPPPPPLPLMPPQFGQSTGGMFGLPFAMVSGSVPPPPPLPNIMSAGFPRLSGPPPPPLLSQSPNRSQTQQQQQQQQQQQSPQAPQQSPTSTGFFQTSGAVFFPPVQVQQSPVQRQ